MAPPPDKLTAALADRYRLERELGQGGMATVYLAEDVKHGRKVAVKVLRPEFAAALGHERFLREISITARLDHPHILPLLDSGQSGDILYYVMPFVEGESLRDRLARDRQLPVADALQITREVADALGHAHGRGVIHRDIKPDNIMLSGGHARVADFGIARAADAAGGEKLTLTGLTLGTPTYMSPEQSVGDRDLDGRSDLYSLGCVLYEMLTGEPPYTGSTAQAIIAKRFREPVPRASTLRETIPPAVETSLTRVMAKSPADRFDTAEQFVQTLTATGPAALHTAETSLLPVTASHQASRSRITRAAGMSLALVSGVALVVVLLRPAREAGVPSIGRTIQVTRDPGLEVDPALSPDGTMLAYAQGPTTSMQIYVQQVSGGRPVALSSDPSDNFRSPRWSPDGTQVAFHGNDGVFVAAALGGSPRRIVRIDTTEALLGAGSFTPISGLTWSPDGQRLAYTTSWPGFLYIVPVAGGTPVRLAAPPLPFSPAWSPDGTRLALAAGNSVFTFGTGYFGNVGNSGIWVVPAVRGPPTRITGDESLNASPQWAPDGRALYWVSDRGGSRDIYQVAINQAGESAGEPQRLTTGLDVHGISLAADGTHLAYSSFRTFSNIWFHPVPAASSGPVPATAARPLTSGNQTIESVDVSADGRWLVFESDRGGNPDLYRMPTAGGEAVQLTTDPAGDFGPAWSRDGSQIVFHSLRSGNRDIFTINADGTGLVQRTATPLQELDPDWAPDGSALAFEVMDNATGAISVSPLGAPGGPARPLSERGDFGRWSPTGEWIVYHVTEGLMLVRPAGGPSRLVVDNARDSAEAFFARWAPDGKTLYYLTRRPTGWAIRAVQVTGGKSRTLVTFDDPTRQPVRYGFATDGRAFYFTLGSHESDVRVMELARR
jgi:serine/threonine-protein kinase